MKRALLIIILWIPVLCLGQQPPQTVTNYNQQPTAPPNNQAESSAIIEEARIHEEEAKAQTESAIQEAASNTRIMWFTGCLVGLAAVQAGIYFFQCRLMRQSIDQSRESSEKALRAYISVSASRESNNGLGDISQFPRMYSFWIKNSGQTPAYDIGAQVSWEAINGYDSHWPEGSEPIHAEHLIDSQAATLHKKNIIRTSLGRDQEIKLDAPLDPHKDGSTFEGALEKFKRKEVALYIFGTIWYNDVFRRKRHSTKIWIAVKSTPTGVVTVQGYRTHNDAD